MCDEKDDTPCDQQMNVHTLIVGAGPTGLGAAVRLVDRGMVDWALFEASDEVGGLASTITTAEGFLFDRGGHVIFSHYNYFDQVINEAVKTGWNVLERVSYVRYKGKWVPYPFQLNLHHLPLEDMISCVNGIVNAAITATANPNSKPLNFDDWIMRVQGEGLANTFMRPYNFKVWAIEPKFMSYGWLGERVAVVSPNEVSKVITNVLRGKDETSWGPNATFKFPLHGGTGQIWKSVASQLLPQVQIHLGQRLVSVNEMRHEAVFDSGLIVHYRHLISTIPYDVLTTKMTSLSQQVKPNLFHASSHIVGIGIRGINPHDVKCWLYFPDPLIVFYRATIFSRYSEFNCPGEEIMLPTIRYADNSVPDCNGSYPGPYWSIMFEISESEYKPVDQDNIIASILVGSIASGLCQARDEIVSIYHNRIEYGYPVPTLQRDDELMSQTRLADDFQIYSRGRFGAWKYEIANQDHSFMQGVECVDRILSQGLEVTLNYPNTVNNAAYKLRDSRSFTQQKRPL